MPQSSLRDGKIQLIFRIEGCVSGQPTPPVNPSASVVVRKTATIVGLLEIAEAAGHAMKNASSLWC